MKFNLTSNSLLKTFIGTASLALAGRGFSILLGILIARSIGPDEFGRYSFVMSLVTLALLPAIAGIPQLTIREVAIYLTNSSFDKLKGYIRWSNCYSFILSLVSSAILGCLGMLEVWSYEVSALIVCALLLLPFKAFLTTQTATLNGFQYPALAQLPMAIIAPLLGLVIMAFTIFVLQSSLLAIDIIYLQNITHFVGCLIVIVLLKMVFKRQKVPIASVSYEFKRWHSALLPFSLLMVVSNLSSELSTVVLGILSTDKDVAYFRVAVQASMLIIISLQVINSILGPKIAKTYKQGKIAKVQELLTQSVRISVISSIPVILLLLIFTEPLIEVLFGVEYLPAASLVRVIIIGQAVNVCMGSVGLVLNMTGNERRTLRAQAITLLITLVLLISLVPNFGALGASVSISISLVVWNVIMAVEVNKKLQLKTWIK